MRRGIIVSLLVVLSWLLGFVPSAAAQQDRVLVLRGVTVITGTDAAPIPDAAVVLRNGWIEQVGPRARVTVPAGARVVDLPGRFILPGFVDMHAHIAIGAWVQDTANGRPTLRYDYDEAATRELTTMQLAFGITTIRNPAGPTDKAVAIRTRVRLGLQEGPRIITAGAPLDLMGQSNAQAGTATVEAVEAEVARQAAAGVDIIKLYAGLSAPLVRAGVLAAHKYGLQAMAHCWLTSWTDAALAGVDGITHIAPGNAALLPEAKRADFTRSIRGAQFMFDWFRFVDFDSAEIREMLGAMSAARLNLDPTLVAFEMMAQADRPAFYPESSLRYVPATLASRPGGEKILTTGWTSADFDSARAVWPRILELTRRLHDAGVLLTVGTDGANPWLFHRELELLVSSGIPPAEVLRMATRNAAMALRRIGEFGTVEAGKRAELVVLSADPIADIRNSRRIEAVVQDGKLRKPAEFLPRRAGGRTG